MVDRYLLVASASGHSLSRLDLARPRSVDLSFRWTVKAADLWSAMKKAKSLIARQPAAVSEILEHENVLDAYCGIQLATSASSETLNTSMPTLHRAHPTWPALPRS